MFEIEQLRSIRMLNYLTDDMLRRIERVTTLRHYNAGEYIFKEGEYAQYVFSVIEGEVVLETEKNPTTPVQVIRITSGMTFGFSALLDTEHHKYRSHAKAHTDVKLFTWKESDLEKLFVEDYEMGFLVMRRIANIIDHRLQITKTQLVDIYQ